MCITAQCEDPTAVGVWWRDDAAWKLYSKETMRDILQALLKGNLSLHFQLTSSNADARGASYLIDLMKMVQTNTRSGHKRAIKLVLPSSFQNPINSNFFNKAEHTIEVDRAGSIVRFRLHGCSSVLVICKGDISKWAADGKGDAVVNPHFRWGRFRSLENIDKRVASAIDTDKQRGLTSTHGLYSITVPAGHQHEPRKGTSVAAALYRAAGSELHESLQQGVLRLEAGSGDPVITPGFKLPASRIIHTIIPKYKKCENTGAVDNCSLLERAYKSALALATENGLRYLAFPAMACGAGGFPVDIAARVAMQVVSSCRSNIDGVKEIHFVLMGEARLFKEWVMQATRLFSKYDP